MLAVIADILKESLSSLEWLERFGGLVSQAVKPVMVQGSDGVMVSKGNLIYPVSCGINTVNCWEKGAFKHLEPDSRKSAIAFFMDNGGVSFKGIEGPKMAHMKFEFELKLVFWLNVARLGEDITNNECQPSGRISPYVISKLFGPHTATGLFGGGIEETAFQAVEVTSVRELTKTPSMFEPFTFASDWACNLFIFPYDFFGLAIWGEFVVNRLCLEEMGLDWVPSDGCLSPVGPTPATLCQKVFGCLNDVEEFNSDEAGLAGGLISEGFVFFVAGAMHDARPWGSLVRLPLP